MKLFIIPGNPPATHFYEVWKKELLQLNPNLEIYISAYPQLNFQQSSSDFLKEVEIYHENKFLQFIENSDSASILIGHSLGAFFSYEILKRNSEKIKRCLLLHPFLRSPRLKGRAILKTINLVRRFEATENIFNKIKPALEKINSDLKYVTQEEASISLKLAFHEQEIIGKNKSPITIPDELRDKTRLIYTPKDNWCNPSTLEELKKQLVSVDLKTSHDFVLYPNERQAISLFMQDFL